MSHTLRKPGDLVIGIPDEIQRYNYIVAHASKVGTTIYNIVSTDDDDYNIVNSKVIHDKAWKLNTPEKDWSSPTVDIDLVVTTMSQVEHISWYYCYSWSQNRNNIKAAATRLRPAVSLGDCKRTYTTPEWSLNSDSMELYRYTRSLAHNDYVYWQNYDSVDDPALKIPFPYESFDPVSELEDACSMESWCIGIQYHTNYGILKDAPGYTDARLIAGISGKVQHSNDNQHHIRLQTAVTAQVNGGQLQACACEYCDFGACTPKQLIFGDRETPHVPRSAAPRYNSQRRLCNA